MLERGSLWRKWDIHVHTPFSTLNNQFEGDFINKFDESFKRYIKELFSRAVDNKISCIGLTDYFSIEGYKKVLEFVSDDENLKLLFSDKIVNDKDYIKKIKNILIIPNIEFRLGTIVVYNDNSQKKFEVHVLFDNKLPINYIEENFLSKINLINGEEKLALTKNNIEKIGIQVKREQSEFSRMSNYEAGCNVAYVDFENLYEVLNNNFKDKFILLFAEDDITNVKWNDSAHMVRKNIYKKCHGIMSSNEKTIAWGLKEETAEEFCGLKPCFWGSDAHKYDDMFKPAFDRYCWIKSDVTFEGLKQVLINPVDRIFIGKENKALNYINTNKSRIIKNIEIKKNNKAKNSFKWFDTNIPLNPYMISIIGNKGSGKSALSDIIAYLCNSKNVGHASFLHNDRFKKQPENYAGDYRAKITWLDDDSNEKEDLSVELDEENIELAQFLPQKFIEDICSGIDNKFQIEIENVIFSYMELSDKEGCADLKQLISKKTEGNNILFQKLINELENLNTIINKLENKKTTKYYKQINEKYNNMQIILEKHLNNKPKSVMKPKKEDDNPYLSVISTLETKEKEYDQYYRENVEKLKEINTSLTKINTYYISHNNILEEINSINSSYKLLAKDLGLSDKNIITFKINDDELIDSKNKLTAEKTKLEKLVSTIDYELGKINIPEISDINTLDIDLYCKQYESLYSKMKLINGLKLSIANKSSLEMQNYQNYIKNLENWENTRKLISGEIEGNPEGSIKLFESELKYIKEQLEIDLDIKYKDRQRIIESIYELHQKNCQILKDLYRPIEEKLTKVLELMEEKINFNVQIVPINNFINDILNHIDQRVSGFFYGKQQGNANLYNLIASTKFNEKESTINFVLKILEEVRKDINETSKLLNNEEVKFYNFITSLEYLRSQYTLTLGGKNLKELSPGERGIVLLIFYLALNKSNMPLIIDQPEDNLDNQSVYSKLVPCIKMAKQQRQIIIVTHNPNIAIACDSEQIIYCEIDKKNNAIRYESGSIENKNIKDKVVDVLEGTMPAFDLRRLKYKVGDNT